ncbi:hypothetical protein Tco_1134650 [Tanacetum coccineum]
MQNIQIQCIFDLDRDGESGFDYLTFALVSSKAPREGVGLRVADSYASNHPEGGFTPFKTIRRLIVVIRRRSHSGFERESFEPERRVRYQASQSNVMYTSIAKDTTAVQRCGLLAKELNEFLSSYPIPSKYDVILSTSTQTIFNAPLVNTEPLKDVEEPKVLPAEVTADSGESLKAGVFVVHPRSVAARIKKRKCKTRGGSSRPHVKRKLASGSSSSRAVRAKTSAFKDDAPFLSIFDDDEGLPDCFELKDANAFNRRARKFLQVIDKISGEADIIKARERSCEEECEGLRVKCEAAMAEFDQNLDVLAFREKISSLTTDVKEHKDKAKLEAVEASLRGEVEELKQDRRDVVSKVVPYAAMKLVHSDELGRLVGKLVSFAITYGCCRAYEQASNDFATATFPGLDELIADAASPIEALLLKKPPTLQKPAPSRTQMPAPSSQKATPSSAPFVYPHFSFC